jgi:hypothetical protein
MTQTSFTTPPGGEIVARPSTNYRVRWAVVGLGMLAYGWWSLYDGFVNWERENRQAVERALAEGKPPPEKLPHNDLGILLNRLIGIALQPLGLFVLTWAFYSSRGRYRLSGSTLEAPGHGPVPLENIREIDKSKWARKGIAYIKYQAPGSSAGALRRLKLDDYIYDRGPTDEILARIEAAVAPPQP